MNVQTETPRGTLRPMRFLGIVGAVYLALVAIFWVSFTIRDKRLAVCQGFTDGMPVSEVVAALEELGGEKGRAPAGQTGYRFGYPYPVMGVQFTEHDNKLVSYLVYDGGSDFLGTGPPWDGIQVPARNVWLPLIVSAFQIVPLLAALGFQMLAERCEPGCFDQILLRRGQRFAQLFFVPWVWAIYWLFRVA